MGVQVGERAPDFILPSTLGTPVQLSTVLSQHTVVLVFYHFAFSGG